MKEVVNRPVDVDVGADVVLDEAKGLLRTNVTHIGKVPRQEIIEADNLMPHLQEVIDEMGADESRPAGDEASGTGVPRGRVIYHCAKSTPRPTPK